MEKFEQNDVNVDKTELEGKEGECPYCGSENVDFHGPDFADDMIFYDCDCPDCENSYQEWYTVQFHSVYGYPLKEKGTE